MAGYNYNMNSYSYNDNLITATIGNDGTIYQESMQNGRIKIGVDNQVVKDMQEIIDNYYRKTHRITVQLFQKKHPNK